MLRPRLDLLISSLHAEQTLFILAKQTQGNNVKQTGNIEGTYVKQTRNIESTYVKQTRKIRAHIERQQEESPKSHVRIVRPGTIARRARPHPPSITVLQVCFTPPLRTSGKYSPNIDQVLTKYQANIARILTKCDQNLTKY